MEPNTLQEAVIYFASADNCREYLVAHRWPNGVTCPRCGSTKVLFQPKYNRWQCGSNHELRQFTSKTGTIFEDSPLSLDKWLMAMWQVVNCKNGVSSYEIHRAIGVTQKTAWFMDHRIRVALGMATPDKMSVSAGLKEQHFRRFLTPWRAPASTPRHTTALLRGDLRRSAARGGFSETVCYSISDPPAPSIGAGALEHRACLVSGRTDSITR